MRHRRRGQARLVETILAALLIITAFSIAFLLSPPPNPRTTRRGEETQKQAYNYLARLNEGGALNPFFVLNLTSNQLYLNSTGAGLLIVALNAVIPSNYAYNFTAFQVIPDSNNFVQLSTPLNSAPITNFAASGSSVVGYTAQASYLYTMPNGPVVVFVLQLALLTSL